MFAQKGPLVSIATRRVQILSGEDLIDYKVDGVRGGIYLFTADKEQLTKGKRHRIKLITQLRPTDRHVAVKVNPDLYKVATISGPTWLDQFDSGEIVLNITPSVDLDLGAMDHIVKILVEGLN